jgi:hypothetical protein
MNRFEAKRSRFEIHSNKSKITNKKNDRTLNILHGKPSGEKP